MKQMKDLSHAEREKTGKIIGSAFVHETGPFADYFTEKEASAYFSCLIQMAVSSHCLYELEDGKGYVIYWRKHHGPSIWQKFLFAVRLCMRIDLQRMQKYMDALHGWQDYEEKYRHEKDYVDLFMVCIPEKEQGKGYLRSLLKEPMELAEQRQIPCILDTDSELKMRKYRHLGFVVKDEMVLSDGSHMYTMEYQKKGS